MTNDIANFFSAEHIGRCILSSAVCCGTTIAGLLSSIAAAVNPHNERDLVCPNASRTNKRPPNPCLLLRVSTDCKPSVHQGVGNPQDKLWKKYD